MSQNQFDFDKAIAGLKAVAPGQVPHLNRETVVRTRRLPYRTLAFALAVSLSFAVFWPRSGSGLAWAQVVSEVKQIERYHLKSYSTKLRAPDFEVWVDGDRYACRISDPKLPNMVLESRCDGKTLVNYQNFSQPRNGEPTPAYKSKVVKEEFVANIGFLDMESNIIDDLLSNKRYEVLRQSESTKDGKSWITYSVLQTESFKDETGFREIKNKMLVYADPESKRIGRTERLNHAGEVVHVTTIEYPNSIPDNVFQFRLKGIEVRDLDAEKARLASSMKKGLGTKTVNGTSVTLRSVLYDQSGGLWVLWTGNPPAGDLKHVVQVLGYPKPTVLPQSFPVNTNVINAFSLKGFTVAAGKQEFRSKPAPSIGEKLYGMGIGIKNQTFKTVDLSIPVVDKSGKTKLGDALFRNVPVQRIQTIYNFSEELGLR